MGALTNKQIAEYTSQPAFTNPAISARATRRTVPDDIWRSLEIVPGALTWGVLLACVIFSFAYPIAVAYFILLFDVFWLMKSISMSHSLIRAYRFLKRDAAIDWQKSVQALSRGIDTYEQALSRILDRVSGGRRGVRLALWNVWQMLTNRPLQQDYRELRDELATVRALMADPDNLINPRDVYHLIIVANYTEELDILRPSFQAIADSAYDRKKLIVVLATEERDQRRARANARVLKRELGGKFGKFIVTEHPDGIVGETKGKGSNISWAARQVYPQLQKMGLRDEQVIVTTLDADHRPHRQYFSALTYRYVLNPNRLNYSFQPTPLFHNNLWHTAAVNRVIATGSSFWHMVESTRAYRLRNFAAHSQGLAALRKTDWWSVDTIVEDGQQYWRSYFALDGEHYVQPIYVPVYQDAVLTDTYLGTLRAQYLQLRRWAWGSSDLPYIVVNALRNKKISWPNKLTQIGRFLEGHFTWATAPILITFVGALPALVSTAFRHSLFGQQVAPTASIVLSLALVGMVVTIMISMLLLPKKPPEYTRRHKLGMVAQWILLPVTTIFFSSLPAIESQTRLMLGQYLEFRVTEKRSGRIKGVARRART